MRRRWSGWNDLSSEARVRALILVLLLLPMQAFAGESTPDAAVSALWRALSNEAGASADVATLTRLFHEDAVVFGARYKDGAPALRRSFRDAFLGHYGQPGEKGFHECEVSRVMQAYDRFAVAYSVVESRADKAAAAADFVGVNSVQLYKVGTEWKILSLYYHVEVPDLPVPLGGGRTGECIG
jgi:ketosteroid isomerase-like protein